MGVVPFQIGEDEMVGGLRGQGLLGAGGDEDLGDEATQAVGGDQHGGAFFGPSGVRSVRHGPSQALVFVVGGGRKLGLAALAFVLGDEAFAFEDVVPARVLVAVLHRAGT